jgi:hypothetical protein
MFETSSKQISAPIRYVGFRICCKLRSPSWTKKIYSLSYVCFLFDSIFESTRRYNTSGVGVFLPINYVDNGEYFFSPITIRIYKLFKY